VRDKKETRKETIKTVNNHLKEHGYYMASFIYIDNVLNDDRLSYREKYIALWIYFYALRCDFRNNSILGFSSFQYDKYKYECKIKDTDHIGMYLNKLVRLGYIKKRKNNLSRNFIIQIVKPVIEDKHKEQNNHICIIDKSLIDSFFEKGFMTDKKTKYSDIFIYIYIKLLTLKRKIILIPITMLYSNITFYKDTTIERSIVSLVKNEYICVYQIYDGDFVYLKEFENEAKQRITYFENKQGCLIDEEEELDKFEEIVK